MTARVEADEAWLRLLRLRGGVGGQPGWSGLSPAAADLVERYGPLASAGPTVAVAQLGQSLDGFIATHCGHARFVTGEEDRRHLHRLRALADAVVVGADTVIADDPQLTVRAVPGQHPVRVLLDRRGRIPLRARVLNDGASRTLWLVGPVTELAGRPASPTAEVVRLAGDGERVGAGFGPADVLAALGRRGLGRVLVEGGGRTVSSFLAAGLLSRLYLTVAPVLIGDGRPGLRFAGPDTMAGALRPPVRRLALGEDMLYELDLGRSAVPGDQAS